MKKNVLALSIAAMIGGLGFAGAASADVIRGTGAVWTPGSGTDGRMTTSTDNAVLEIADAGTGHMLLMPYFNAQNNNMTVLHVVNTDTSNGKAVKVRFRSAANSDDILDFQVFMSPADVWTAAVSAGPDGIAQITTADGTCTVPKLAKGVAQPFVTDRLNPSILPADKANQTREGYVEIFNMADIRSDRVYTSVGAPAAAASPLYTAIKHVNGVAPCATVGSAAESTLFNVATNNFTTEGAAAFAGLDTPTGGLLGDWYIINTAQTTTFSGGATSISAKTTFGASGASARGSFVHFPQIDTAVDVASMQRYSADPLFRTDAYYNSSVANNNTTPPTVVGRNTVAGQNLAGAFYDLPDMSTPYVTSAGTAAAPDNNAPKIQAAVLTRALAVTSLTNQYATDASISAKTDWVFSMPTRRYNVAANYSAVANGATAQNAPTYRLFTDLAQAGTLPGNGQAGVPATPNWFVPANTSVDILGNICVNSDGQRLWDREETTAGTTGQQPVFSPRTPGVPSVVRFCGEVSVLQFKDTGSSVLGASVARTTLENPGFDNGWGLISTNNVVNGATVGLPILGFGVQRLTNPNVGNGVSGNFGITWPHRNTRLIAQ